jgi:hypothetical protein
MNYQHKTKSSWTKYLRQLVHDDRHGSWFAFSLTSELPPASVIKKLARRCEANSISAQTSSADSIARVRRRGVCAFVVPSVSAAGHTHTHGMVRVPKMFSQPGWEMDIQEHGTTIRIDVPLMLAEVFRTQYGEHADTAFININILNDGRRAVVLGHNDDFDERRTYRYWTKTEDGEVRNLNDAEFVPHWVRAALPNANTERPH